MSANNEQGSGSKRPFQPDLNWAIATNFAYLRPGEWLPLLVEFDPKSFSNEAGSNPWKWFVDKKWLPRSFGDDVLVPTLFRNLPAALVQSPKFTFCVLLVRRKAASSVLAMQEWNMTILGAEVGPPIDLVAIKAEALSPSISKAPGSIGRVVMGVIDQGIAFAHPRFRNQTGSRVEYIWQQDVVPSPQFLSPLGVFPSLAAPGRMFKAVDIDNALTAAGGDEEAAYRAIGGLDYSVEGYKPLARARSHGTMVLDLMAGVEPADNVTTRPIIAVDMPEHAVGDPSGSLLTPYALWGLAYIMVQAEQLRQSGETLPVVVNLSYGPHEGPHDGSSMFERFVDLWIELYETTATPLSLILAAGNSRQARVHAHARLQPGKKKKLQWRLQPGGRTPSALHLWLNAGGSASVTLRAPTGLSVTVSPMTLTAQSPLAPAVPTFFAEYFVVGGRACVTLTVASTDVDPDASSLPIANSGVWTVEVINAGANQLTLDGCIRRSDTLAGRRAKGRQSYFDVSAYTRYFPTGRPKEFDATQSALVCRRSTLSGIATGERTIVVGGYRRSEDYPATYTSQGPHENPSRANNAPDWLAPSDDSVTCSGVLAAGNRSNSVSKINGSSAAAPQSARLYADLWILQQKRPTLPASLFRPVVQYVGRTIPPADVLLVAGLGLTRGNAQRVPRP